MLHEEDPDLTECFQLVALVWVPCAFLILFTPLEFYYIKKSRQARIPWGLLNISKFIVTTLLIVLSIVDLAMAITKADGHPEEIFDVHFTTPPIRLVSFLITMILVLLHKKKGIRTSGLLFLFWTFLVLAGIVQYRTEIRYIQSVDGLFGEGQSEWRDYKALSYMFYFPLITIALLLNCVSDKAPAGQKKSKTRSPEVGASFLRQLFFQWFDAMTWHGYRKPLVTEDMFDLLDEDKNEVLTPAFDKYWQQSVEKNRKKLEQNAHKGTDKKTDKATPQPGQTNGSVLPAMVKAFGGPFWFAGILKLALDLLSFASPQLLG